MLKNENKIDTLLLTESYLAHSSRSDFIKSFAQLFETNIKL